MIKKIYKILMLVLIIIILYSTYIFGFQVNNEKIAWKLYNTKLLETFEWSNLDIQSWQKQSIDILNSNKSVKYISTTNDPIIISPKIKKNDENNKIITVVEISLVTNPFVNSQLFWITDDNKDFCEENSIQFKNKWGISFRHAIDDDIVQIRLDPSNKAGDVFVVNDVIVRKYIQDVFQKEH